MMARLTLVLLLGAAATASAKAGQRRNLVGDEDGGEAVELVGENVCIDQTTELKVINVTYLQSHDVKEYTWCLKIPPRCPKWVTKMVTRVKPKEIMRVVNHHRCCQGFAADGNRCEPVCTERCLHGGCVEPDTCSCEPGFSGATCAEVGCPGGNWGPDCSEPCPCQNAGLCQPHTGKCLCPPGFEGLDCERPCPLGRFGPKCAAECACAVGHRCHHITGECAPCPEGTFGLDCAGNCSCAANGTALCYHENGNCFCTSNFYGRRCEMYCPFGYLDGICHTKPMALGYCSCASDMYRCDRDLGCVCKDGFDCEGGTRVIDFSPLQQADGSSSAQAGVIVAVVVVLCAVALILVGLYYRRRMLRMKKDLENRSVRYIENSVLDPVRNGSVHVVKHNELEATTNSAATVGMAPVQRSPGTPNNRGVMNVRNNVGYVGHQQAAAEGATARPEKNVNIDKFKLGEDEEAAGEADGDAMGACAASAYAGGACALPDEPEAAEASATSTSKDVNVFSAADDWSPSKAKNNIAKLDRKVAKTNVNIVINNTRDEGLDNVENEEEEILAGRDGDEDDSDDDGEMDLKVYAHLSREDGRP